MRDYSIVFADRDVPGASLQTGMTPASAKPEYLARLRHRSPRLRLARQTLFNNAPLARGRSCALSASLAQLTVPSFLKRHRQRRRRLGTAVRSLTAVLAGIDFWMSASNGCRATANR